MDKKELEAMRDSILAEMNQADEAIVSMKDQIARAQQHVQEYGRYSDADWYRRINTALRYKGKRRQELQLQLGEVNRKLRDDKNYDPRELFIVAARRLLPQETIDAIWAEARILRAERDST